METNITATPVVIAAENVVAEPPIHKEAAKPVAAKDRIQTIDMIRGIALCGILLMNIPGFGLHWNQFFTILQGPHNVDYHTFTTIEIFFSGTMRGLFSMLFGAGMVLFTQNKNDIIGGPTVAELYYRRLLLLVVFGLFNAYILLWPGDILFFYGLGGMILYPFRKLAAKWLLVLGLVCIGIGVLKYQLRFNEMKGHRTTYLEAVKAEKEGKKLTPEQESGKAAWLERQNWKPDADRAKEEVQKRQGDYGTVWTLLLGDNAGSETWGTYHGIWDILCMMFIGMGLFALGFFTNKWKTSSYVMGLLIGYGVGIPVGWLLVNKGIIASLDITTYVDSYRMTPEVLYDVKRVTLSVGHACLAMLIFRSHLFSWLMKGLANIGQMAFTNYLVQSIICTFIFHGYGLGYYNQLRFHQLYYIVAGVWIFQIIFSAIWLRYFRFGPFEWAWRSLTYGKSQPMRLGN